MIKLYHSPNSRSTAIISLLRQMGKEDQVAIETVHIRRQGGYGQTDPQNPHPEGKVPLLEVDGHFIRERGAIILWLTDHFDSPLGRSAGSPARSEYLSWLFYYGNVMEPVMYLTYLGIADSDLIKAWCRDQDTMIKTLEMALTKSAFLVDDAFSAADLLISAPFQWFPDLIPENSTVQNWFDRCMAAQDSDYIEAFDARGMEKLGLPSVEDMYADT